MITLRQRIVSTLAVNLAWTMVWIEVKGQVVSGLIWPLMPWN